jgi:hypothetical protein
MISVSSNKKQCRKENLNYVASLSERDKYLDHMLLRLWKIITLPFMWGWTGVILSIIYIVWYAISSKQGVIFYSIIFAGFAVILFLNLTQILRPVAGFPFPSPYSFGTVDCNPGTITFNAILSKVHYETLVIFLIGILMEFAVLVIMFRQTRQAVERKDS